MGDDNLESLVRNGFADMKTLFADVKADVATVKKDILEVKEKADSNAVEGKKRDERIVALEAEVKRLSSSDAEVKAEVKKLASSDQDHRRRNGRRLVLCYQ